MRKIIKSSAIAALVVGLSFLVAGCSTNTSGQVNPAFTSVQVNELAILFIGNHPETALRAEAHAIETLREYGVSAEGFTKYHQFAEHPSEVRQLLLDAGYTHFLFAGTGQEMNRYATGTSTCREGHTGRISCSDDVGVSRNTNTFAFLVDAHTADKVWVGEGQRSSIGGFAYLDVSAVADLVDEVIEEMSRDGVIPHKID